MIGGTIRFACMIIVLLAIMNSRVYTQAEIDQQAKEMKKSMEDVKLPTYMTMQHAILVTSFTGHLLRDKAPILLIASIDPSQLKHETIAKKDEKTMNEIFSTDPAPAKK